MSKIVESEHQVNRLAYLLRTSRGDPDSLEAYRFAFEYLTAMLRSLAATDKVILRKVEQRIATITDILENRKKG